VKVLLDECVDWRLARDIPGHEVKTARQMGWTTIRNGELLALAAASFDVFVTVDRSLDLQPNPPSFPIAVIVLAAKTNRAGVGRSSAGPGGLAAHGSAFVASHHTLAVLRGAADDGTPERDVSSRRKNDARSP
jgi:hypothetical protein